MGRSMLQIGLLNVNGIFTHQERIQIISDGQNDRSEEPTHTHTERPITLIIIIYHQYHNLSSISLSHTHTLARTHARTHAYTHREQTIPKTDTYRFFYI